MIKIVSVVPQPETVKAIREKDAHHSDIIRLQRPNGAFVMTATP